MKRGSKHKAGYAAQQSARMVAAWKARRRTTSEATKALQSRKAEEAARRKRQRRELMSGADLARLAESLVKQGISRSVWESQLQYLRWEAEEKCWHIPVGERPVAIQEELRRLINAWLVANRARLAAEATREAAQKEADAEREMLLRGMPQAG